MYRCRVIDKDKGETAAVFDTEERTFEDKGEDFPTGKIVKQFRGETEDVIVQKIKKWEKKARKKIKPLVFSHPVQENSAYKKLLF